MNIVGKAGWACVAIAIVILLGFGGARAMETFGAAAAVDAFGIRYVEHPVAALLHILPGLLFIVLAPLQFLPQLRRRYPRMHRWNGRVLVVLGLLSGAFALVVAAVLPAFGGATTTAATVLFGGWFIWSLVSGYRSIRAKRVAAHREWMIRAFSIGLGVATIRLVIGVTQATSDLTMEQVFGPAFWVGLSINASVAEVWIRTTRTSRS